MIVRYGLLIILLLASAAWAENKRDVTFSSGLQGLRIDSDKSNVQTGITSSSCRQGKCIRLERRRHNRLELTDKDLGRAPVHREVWYGWSVKVDKNENDKRLIVGQIHHHQGQRNRDNQWSKTASFLIRHDRRRKAFTLKHGYQRAPKKRKDNFVTLSRAEYGKWYDFVVQAKWTWRNDGFVKIWIDDKLVYDHKGSSYFDYGSRTLGPYWKAGAYGGRDHAIVSIDQYAMCVAADCTYEDVDPNKKFDPPPDAVLPEIKIKEIAWGKTGDNHIGITIEAVDPTEDPQLSDRRLNEDRVTFFSLDSQLLTIHRHAQSESVPGRWTIYLDKPVPQENIRMVAQEGWITGLPAVDELLARWAQEPQEKPVHQMERGDTARCPTSVQVDEQDSRGVRVHCMSVDVKPDRDSRTRRNDNGT